MRKHIAVWVGIVSLALTVSVAARAGTTADSLRAALQVKRTALVTQVSLCQALSAQTRPSTLSANDAAIWESYDHWLDYTALRTYLMVLQIDQVSAQLASMTAAQLLSTQASFNLQYQALQSQMQNENRSYTALANVMKAKHDAVGVSIANAL